MDIDGDGTYALVATREHMLSEYARLLARLGLPAVSFPDGTDAAEALPSTPPAVAILEVESGGCALLRELRDRFGSELPVVLVSADRTAPSDVVAGLLVGADDYAAESMDANEFVARVRRLVDRAGRNGSGAATVDLSRLSALTQREREVLALVADGRSQKQIASALGISIKTVGTHVQNLLAKLGVHSRVEAVAIEVRARASGSVVRPAAG